MSARRLDHVIVKKKKRKGIYRMVDFEESKKGDKYVDLARELKNTVEHEIDGNTNCNGCVWYSHQGLVQGLKGWR